MSLRDPRLNKGWTPNITTMQPGKDQPTQCGPTTPTVTSTTANPAVITAPKYYSLSRNSTRQIYPGGRDSCGILPAKDVLFHVIKWDPQWLNAQIYQEMYPPILGPNKINSVKDTYASEDEYSNTYFRLHFLNIWCDICSSWKSNPKKYQCRFDDYEEKTFYFKNTCRQVVTLCDIPFKHSIILVTYTRADGRRESLFGYVYDVKTRPTDQKGSRFRPPLKDVLFSFYTDQKIQTEKKKSKVAVQKLSRVGVAIRQYEALVSGKCSALKSVVLNPENYTHKIRVINLPSYSHCSLFALKGHIDDIIQSCMSSETLITLVQKPHGEDTLLVILTLINKLLAKSTIMICLRDVEKLHKIAGNLKINENEYSVVAVKESEITVAEDFQQCTLRARSTQLRAGYTFHKRPSKRAESCVIKNSKIILTVLPNIYLGESESLDPETIFIIDEAHMATEAETALALNLSPRNVVLLGDSTESPDLDPFLKRLHYHNTLFHRLFKYVKESLCV